jgi:hypothetical protein
VFFALNTDDDDDDDDDNNNNNNNRSFSFAAYGTAQSTGHTHLIAKMCYS